MATSVSTTVSTAAIVTCTSLATAGASIIAISVAYSVTTASAIVVDRCGSAWLLLQCCCFRYHCWFSNVTVADLEF